MNRIALRLKASHLWLQASDFKPPNQVAQLYWYDKWLRAALAFRQISIDL